MIWLISIVLYVHILGAILWFGSSAMFQFIFVPALGGMPFEAQRPWLQALAARYGPLIGVVGGVTMVFGVLRGVLTGVLASLGGPYGVPWLAAIVLGIPLVVLGPAFIGPTASKMAAASNKDQVMALAARMTTYGRIEVALVLVLLALMVAMHAGF